jgi:hypothetical protein
MPLLNRYLNVSSVITASLFLLLCCIACQNKPNNSKKADSAVRIPRISEGVAGSIVFKEGSFKSNGELGFEGRLIGVARKIYVYKETNMHAVNIAEGDFLTNIYSELVDSLESNQDGYFEKRMPPGNYSLFILENKRLYSKLNDEGYYYPVQVVKDSVSRLNLEIDYQAVY